MTDWKVGPTHKPSFTTGCEAVRGNECTVLLRHHLKSLKLPTMHDEGERIARRCASDNADQPAFLLPLCELELIEREEFEPARWRSNGYVERASLEDGGPGNDGPGSAREKEPG